MNQVQWIALAALIVGGLVRALKTDAFGSVLQFFGFPDGTTIPRRALPFLALGLGAASSFLDTRMTGASWSVAIASGIAAAATAVLGHELGSGVPGVKRVLSVVFVIGVIGATSACTKQALQEARVAEQAACVIAHAELPDPELARVCQVTDTVLQDLADEIDAKRKELREQREERARLEARLEQMRARAGECGRDGGAR